MHVLVTGGLGQIGQVVTTRLLERGYKVRVIDTLVEQDVSAEITAANYRQADLRDFERVRVCCENIDAVVHLAAIPQPLESKSAEIFHINAGGTFNVYQAAAEAGIKRVVSASSINVLGNGYGQRFIKVHYLPIDEAHPGYTTDVYAFSKTIGEKIAAYFWRYAGISSFCLRFPFVFDAAKYPAGWMRQHVEQVQTAYETLLALPESARRQQVETFKADYLQRRRQVTQGKILFSDIFDHLEKTPGAMLLFGYADFWAILDVRDAALAVEKALQTDVRGCHPLFVTDSHNSAGLPSRDLAGLLYPKVQTWEKALTGPETLFNIDRARAVLGFEPENSVSRLWPADEDVLR